MTCRTPLLSAMMLCAFVTAAHGAVQEAGSAQDEASSRAPRSESVDSARMLTLDFPGGTVAQYVDLIRNTLTEHRQAANIMLKDGAADVTLPAMELMDVSLSTALKLLHQHRSSTPTGDAILDIELVTGAGAPIYIVSAHPIGDPAKPPSGALRVHVWNVGELLAGDIKADDLLTAIEIALSLVQASDEPTEIRFHDATGLVIARGTPAQISTIDQVIHQLKNSAERASIERDRKQKLQEAGRAMMELESREKALAAAQQQVAELDRERESLTRELQMVQDRNEVAFRELQAERLQQESRATREITELEHMVRQLQEELHKVRSDDE